MSVASKERLRNAVKATRALGILDNEVKPVLKQLLKVYEGNWGLIEADNYRALLDAYFDFKENKGAKDKTKSVERDDASERPSKRPHFEEQKDHASSTSLSQILAEGEQGDISMTTVGQGMGDLPQLSYEVTRDRRIESSSLVTDTQFSEEVKDPMLPQMAPVGRNSTYARASQLHSKQPAAKPCSSNLRRKDVHICRQNRELNKLRNEQINDEFLKHISVIRPASSEGSSGQNHLVRSIQSQHDVPGCNNNMHSEIVIASSNKEDVKILLNCGFKGRNFQIPDFNEAVKYLEEQYLRLYKLVTPQFSVMALLKDLCECYMGLHNAATNSSSEVRKVGNFLHGPKPNKRAFGIGNSSAAEKKKVSHLPGPPNSCDLVNVQPVATCDEKRFFHNLNDITKGAEKVKIPLVDEIGTEDFPRFTYMSHNTIYQNAYMQISLARIADVDCCSSCLGDCLSSSIPCACARETGGEFAYTQDGLLKEEFLTACMSMKWDPQKDHFVFCQDCPLERFKNEDMPEKCKGHLVRKFIKECWIKCGCDMNCGNRVVQRGISCNLQVFLTREGKGWGLRTVMDLPKGTFVCEYVGEVVTNTELYERNMENSGSDRHTYPVTLDADWGSERVLRDEEALCLDATFSGNVARFINHRCNDPNLIDIPVEVETPDRHYYHLAFFTTRDVKAMEELTWDYGIDFDDHEHPIKAFKCCCGSTFCRDLKQKGSRARAHSNGR